MNNLIDLFDVKTYPKQFVNAVNEFGPEVDYYDLDKVLNCYYIQCAHTTRVHDKSTIEKEGLLRPFIVEDNENEKYHINDKLKESILNPYKNVFSDKEIDNMEIEYDSLLIKEYIEAKESPLEEYFGKFSVVHFTYDNVIQAALDNFKGYKNFLTYQGGELIDMKKSTLVKNKTKPYIILFKIKISSLPFQVKNELYYDMVRIYFKEELKIYPSGYVNKDIPPSDIIEIREVEYFE